MKYSNNTGAKKSRKKTIILTVVISCAVLLISGVVGARIWYQQQLQPVNAEQTNSIVFTIKPGTSAQEVANQLQKEKLIQNATVFMWYLRTNKLQEGIQAGTYQLSEAYSTPDIIDIITEGKVKRDLFTILPGQRIDQIKASLIKAGYSESDATTALDPANYKSHPALSAKPASASLEGYLYPDSFQKTTSTTASQIVEQSLDEMAKALTAEVTNGFQQRGLNVHQGVTLASIAMKEASNPVEKKKIIGVFLNRLSKNMPLGSDVTYQYIADITGQPRSADIDSPYNTRKYPGLPPGPISNVNKAALEAVAYPTKTDYLFFVAGDDGTIYYSKTLEEHEALAKKYCIKLCSTY